MNRSEQVAIVGIGGCFSGSPSIERFWANVRDGVDTARDVPASRWRLPPADVYRPGEPAPSARAPWLRHRLGGVMDRSWFTGIERADVARGLVSLLGTVLGLVVAGWLLPGLSFDGWVPVLLVGLVMAVVGGAIRPVLVAIATPLGMLSALVLALLGQAAVTFLALSVVPGVRVDSFLDAFWAIWVVAVVTTLTSWVMTAGTNDVVFAHLVRGARRGARVPDPDVTGVLFVQLDGVLPDYGRFNPLDWGLGVELKGEKAPHWSGSRTSPRTFGHFGGSGTFLWVDPERDLACAVLTTRDFGDWAKEAWPRLSDAVLAELA